MISVKKIILHNSASKFGDIFLINKWHREAGYGWREPKSGMIIHVGYHYVIYNGFLYSSNEYDEHCDGLIVPARPEGVVGAHCLAQGMNKKSIGICFIGQDYFTDKQLDSGKKLVASLLQRYNLKKQDILGHKEVDPRKQDPKGNMDDIRVSLTNYNEYYL